MANDTVGKTLIVAVLLCIVCSVLVSTATVKLKPLQEANKKQFTRTNILKAAGLWEKGVDVNKAFQHIERRFVDLSTGEYDTPENPKNYDARRAVRNKELSIEIPDQKDLADIQRRVKTAEVYLIKRDEQVDGIILPVYGKGLWSTMYGFLALEEDGNTVKGLSFYDHGETPGLGGEIENPQWQEQWEEKKVYDENGDLAIEVLKGKVDTSKPDAIHKIDGLSGATLTTKGVHNMMRYWLGEHGFADFLSNLRKEGVSNG